MPCPLNMGEKYPKRKSIRLREYDYATPGAYFVTICAFNKLPLFGQILDCGYEKNEFGEIAEYCWQSLADHFPNVELDTFIVMPDHVHGILIILENEKTGTACRAPTFNRFAEPRPGNLATIIRSYKSAVTKQINSLRKSTGSAVWQRGYYEHVIRSKEDLDEIRNYITTNSVKLQGFE